MESKITDKEAHKYQVIFLGNKPFEIYGKEKQLKEVGNHNNVIELEKLRFKDGNYEFIFNKQSGTLEENPRQELIAGYERILLPGYVAKLDEALDKTHTDLLNERSKNEHWGIYLADDYTCRILIPGKPVEFDFGTDTFTLDVQKEIYFENARPENIIRIADLPSSPAGYELDYDPVTKNIADKNETGQTIFYFMDQMVAYDPLGVAKKYNISIGRLPEYDQDLNHEKVLQRCREFRGNIPSAEKKVVKGIIPKDPAVQQKKRNRIRR